MNSKVVSFRGLLAAAGVYLLTAAAAYGDTGPQITLHYPPSTLPSWTTYTHIAVDLDRPGSCRMSTERGDRAYEKLPRELVKSNIPNRLEYQFPRVARGRSYALYLRCMDNKGVKNTEDFVIRFTVSQDTTAPKLLDIAPSAVRETSAEIVWTTDEPGDSRVEFIGSANTKTLLREDTYTHLHATLIKDLTPNTTYSYRVSSRDAAGNRSWSDLQTFTTRALPQKSFFVATTGSDQNDGLSYGTPFATLERARDAIRALKNGGGIPAGGVKVIVRGGIYYRDQPFQLTALDSGTAGAPIIYTTIGRELPRIIGAKKLTGFTLVNDKFPIYNRLDPVARGKVYQVDLRANGITDFGTIVRSGALIKTVPSAPHLYVNNKPMTLARWPNGGYSTLKSVPAGTRDTFVANDSRPSRWQDPTNDVWVHGAWRFHYRDSHQKIQSATPAGEGAYRIQLAAPGDATGLYQEGRPFYYENILEEIDQAGEWYLDRLSGMLYLWSPTQNIETADPRLSIASELLTVRGATHITFSGINFEAARGTAITIDNSSRHVMIERARIRNAGIGASIAGYQNGIWGSEIYNIEDNAVVLLGGNDKTLQSSYNYVVDNKIYDFARKNQGYRAAVNIGSTDTYVNVHTVGARVRHNEIYNGAHYGVVFKGNNLLIDYNDIHHVLTNTVDAGAIYTSFGWVTRGTMIRYNYIHDIEGYDFMQGKGGELRAAAIYLDGDQDGIATYGNVINRVKLAYFLNGGRDNTFINNIIVNCLQPYRLAAPGMSYTGASYRIPIIGVSDSSPVTITTSRPHFSAGIAQNTGNDDKAIVSGIIGATELNGEWSIGAPSKTTVELIGASAPGVGRYLGGGYFLSRSSIYEKLFAYNYLNHPYSTFYPTLTQHLTEGEDVQPLGNILRRNIHFNNHINDLAIMYAKTSLPQVNASNYIIPENMITEDPLFVDSAADNFTLHPNSPAYAQGFKVIPWENIGKIR